MDGKGSFSRALGLRRVDLTQFHWRRPLIWAKSAQNVAAFGRRRRRRRLQGLRYFYLTFIDLHVKTAGKAQTAG